MRTLIISDIHHRIHKAQAILDKETFDKVVFLGDYFDFYKDPDAVGTNELCIWLKAKKSQLGDKAIWLIGNHDVPYFEEIQHSCNWGRRSESKIYSCTGYSRNRAKQIKKMEMKDFFFNTKLFHFQEGVLFSHAGLHPNKLKPFVSIEDQLVEISQKWDELKPHMALYKSEFYDIGEKRGGSKPLGHLLWLDWDNCEYIEGLPQVVGHTSADRVRINGNYCIDTCNNHYAILENGKISIFEV